MRYAAIRSMRHDVDKDARCRSIKQCNKRTPQHQAMQQAQQECNKQCNKRNKNATSNATSATKSPRVPTRMRHMHVCAMCAIRDARLPTPYTLHPTPYTLHSTPYILHLSKRVSVSVDALELERFAGYERCHLHHKLR